MRFSRILLVFAALSFQAHAQSPNEKLEAAREGFWQAIERDVFKKQEAATADLDAKYLAALDTAVAAATREGNLDLTLILKAEKERASKSEPRPTVDADTPPALRSMYQKYDEATVRLEKASNMAKAPLLARYIERLKALEVELTQSGDLTAALEARREQEEMQATTKATAVTPGGQPKTPAATGTSRPPQEISVKGISGRRFIWGYMDGKVQQPYSAFTFTSDGRIQGVFYKNEATWKVDEKGKLLIYDTGGKVSTIMREPKWKNGYASILGDYQYEKDRKHFLEELIPCKIERGLLPTRVLTGARFEFAVTRPKPSENQKIEMSANGDIKMAKFDPKPTWSLDSKGQLVFKKADGKTEVVFDTVYIFGEGKSFYLEGAAINRPGVTYRLLQFP